MKERRAYRSQVREQLFERTRERIFDAARAIVEKQGMAALTVAAVAQAAGVSHQTVYNHYPTLDDLHVSFLDWMRPRIGMTLERLLGGGPDELLALPEENFPRFEEHGALLRELMDSPAWNRARQKAVRDRAERGAEVLRPLARGWREADLAAAAGALYALQSPQSWRWLRDTWGLDGNQARRAVVWAMHTLAERIARGPATLEVTKKKRGGR